MGWRSPLSYLIVAAGAFVLAGKWVAMIYTHLMETSICPGGC